jgi:hypothetical protein
LLPEGTPSTPHIGDLVASAAGPGRAYRLYADGRLISLSNQTAGWVEQRLTPEGVERVRARFLASGLFDPAQPPSDAPCTEDASKMCARGDDGRLLSARESASDAAQLISYLATLDSSLPTSEWADPLMRPYVASRIMVCLEQYVYVPGRAVRVPPDLPILLSLFPTRAAELLGRDPLRRTDIPEDATCFEMTLDEARTLEAELLSPAGGGSHQYWGIVFAINRTFDAIQPGGTEGNAARITFQALLPDGASGAVGG